MKTILPLILILGGMQLLHAQFTLTDSLVAWYQMDGNAADSSGNANHGTLFGPTLTTDRFGNPNSAYQFDGVDDYVTVDNNMSFQPGYPMTFAAWIYIYDHSTNIIFNNCFQLGTYDGLNFNLFLGQPNIQVGDGGPSGPGSRRSKTSTSFILLNTWNHVSYVVRGPLDMDIFVNGKQDCGTYDGSGGPLAYLPGQDGMIGQTTAGGNGSFFWGRMDDLRFYNRELSEDEIRILADFPGQDTAICVGDSVQLDAGYGSLISWTPTDSLSCTFCKDPIAFPGMTTNFLAITANTPGCHDSVHIQVDVTTCSTDPCDTVDLNANFQYNANGLNLLLTDLSSGSDLDQIKWSLGDGFSTNFVSPGNILSHNYAVSDTYEVCVYAMDFDGEQILCADTLCQLIKIVSDTCKSYQASFSYSLNGSAITVTDNSSPPSQVSNWDFGDGNVASTTGSGSAALHNYSSTNTSYDVCLKIIAYPDSQTTCRDTVCQTIFIIADTCNSYQADFSYSLNGSAITVTDNSSPPSQVSNWDFGDGNVASTAGSGSGAIHNYSNTDTTYTVCLEMIAYPDSQTTCRDTICQVVSFFTSLEEELATQGWSVFPNPSTGKIQVRFARPQTSSAGLRLYDLSGKLVFQQSLIRTEDQLLFLPELSPGVYLLQLQGPKFGKHHFQKLILH
jgi:hypothetical protein